MVTSELLSYVQQQLSQGISQDDITRVLLAQGWPLEDVRASLGQMAPPPPPPPPAPSAPMPQSHAQLPTSFSNAGGSFQQQHPLSPRKFWKKLIEKVFTSISLLLILGMVVLPVMLVLAPTGANPAGTIGLSIMLALVLWVLIILLYAWYVRVYIRRYFYDASDSFITIRKGVFAPAEIHVQYAKIQDVYVDQDILDRIMGLYDVHLASATVTSGIEAHIDGVDAETANKLKEFLLGMVRGGGGAGGASVGGQGTVAAQGPVRFDKEISSATYPIVGSWVVEQLMAWVVSSAVYSFFIVLFLDIPSSHSSSSSLNYTIPQAIFYWIIFGIVIYVIGVVYTLIWRSTFSFSFLADYIMTKKGVIAKSETHLPYRSVQDVTVSQNVLERMFGLATVRIENAAQMVGSKGQRTSSAVRLPGQPLSKANEISDELRKVVLTHSAGGTGL